MATEKVKVTINGIEVEAEKGAVLLDVCKDNAENIPSFCYYKDLEPQASCRMCLVRIEKMPKLQTSCTIKVTDGMNVTTRSAEIEKAQRAMGEFLLTNHPLDCPVCDRGGECELQEVIFDWGDVEERFTEKKNAKPEKYLSPIVANDPQRCILCKRCTRVCDEWMGEEAIEAGNRGVNTVIGTYGGWLDCSQCGNCIEVCPTGTLLDGVYRHETRPWELTHVVTTDTYSSDGMQLTLGARGDYVHRIVARDRYVNGLNGEFLDVKARFAHEFINHKDRIKTPLIRYSKGGKFIPGTWDAAINFVAERLKAAESKIGVIASPRLTNESIFALKRFATEVAKTDNYAIADRYSLAPFFNNLSAPLGTHQRLRHAKTIVLIGGEPEEEQTFTGKQIRMAVRNGGANFIAVNEREIRLRRAAKQFIHLNRNSYDAFAIAFADAMTSDLATTMGIEAAEFDAMLQAIGQTEGDVMILVGGDLSENAQAAIAAAAGRYASDTRNVFLQPLAPYNNSVGARDMMPDAKSVEELALNSSALLIAGSLQDARVLEGMDFVVVQEMFETETTAYADVILPASSFAEVDGTYTNNTGFVQRVRKAIEQQNQSKADWMITSLIAKEFGVDFGYNNAATAAFRAISDNVPAYAGLRYPDLKDESRPVQVKHEVVQNPNADATLKGLRNSIATSPSGGKDTGTPYIGHKLHRLTVMTSKTPQFHLLANGNPKPTNLLLAPLEQFKINGSVEPIVEMETAEVGVLDRE